MSILEKEPVLEKEPIGIMKNWIKKGTRKDYLQTRQIWDAFMEIH